MTLGKSPSETMTRLARYYYDSGYKSRDVRIMLEEFLLRCDPYANVVKWQDTIDWCVKRGEKRPLLMIDPIAVTKGELARIQELDGVRLQRVMFTLLCLAKYGNAANPKNNGWVNQDTKDIFARADVKITRTLQALLFNDLWAAGYIAYNNIVDNLSVRVLICEEEGEEAARIDDFRSLGNQYMMLIGEKYMKCCVCGLTVRQMSPHQKYCKDCAATLNIRQTVERRKRALA